MTRDQLIRTTRRAHLDTFAYFPSEAPGGAGEWRLSCACGWSTAAPRDSFGALDAAYRRHVNGAVTAAMTAAGVKGW